MNFSTDKTLDIVGVGNAMMDLLVQVDDQHVADLGLEKGNTYFVDAETALKRLEEFEVDGLTAIPGGAAANALKTAAVLGADTAFFGVVGNDLHGTQYAAKMREHGVETHLVAVDDVTGHALTFITPDAERTFSDHLGAILQFRPEHLDPKVIAAAKVLHLEAYQLEGDTKAVVEAAIATAKEYGVKVSLDLTDPLLVKRHLDTFKTLVTNDIDILFANEAEAEAFTGEASETALKVMAEMVDLAVLKIGEDGSMISHEGQVTNVAAITVEAVDTTGAGDVYAGAFLHALTEGKSLRECGELGSKLAAKIIQHVGVPAEVLASN